MNLCNSCLYQCMNITKAFICDKYIENKGNIKFYYKKREDVGEN